MLKLLCMCMHDQPCQTLCYPMDCSPQDSSVHGILQAKVLEWTAISFSRGPSWLVSSVALHVSNTANYLFIYF